MIGMGRNNRCNRECLSDRGFSDTVDFDPGPGTDIQISAGGRDAFLTKINSDGTYGWTKTLVGTGSNSSSGITLDTNVNIYLTGGFQNTVDFDPGSRRDNKTSLGNSDIFLTKLNHE